VDDVIIECAINGTTAKAANPHVPIEPAEIAADALACFDAGAAIVHNHIDRYGLSEDEAAERYLARLDDYPLPLDAALPIWSWTLQLREQEVVGLLQSTDPAQLPTLDFVKQQPSQGFEVTRTTFLHGSLLREGDVLKGETLDASDLQKAAHLLAKNLAPASERRTVALFDLSERNLSRHGLRTLEQAFQVVR